MPRKRNPLSIPMMILFLIIASGLLKLINFSNFSIQKPVLALVYAICLGVLIYIILKPGNHQDDTEA